jgi:hypothetical protein
MVSPVQGYWQLVLEFLASLIERETDWLAPAFFVLLIVAALGFFLEGSVVAPASYSILAQQCSYPTRAASALLGVSRMGNDQCLRRFICARTSGSRHLAM